MPKVTVSHIKWVTGHLSLQSVSVNLKVSCFEAPDSLFLWVSWCMSVCCDVWSSRQSISVSLLMYVSVLWCFKLQAAEFLPPTTLPVTMPLWVDLSHFPTLDYSVCWVAVTLTCHPSTLLHRTTTCRLTPVSSPLITVAAYHHGCAFNTVAGYHRGCALITVAAYHHGCALITVAAYHHGCALITVAACHRGCAFITVAAYHRGCAFNTVAAYHHGCALITVAGYHHGCAFNTVLFTCFSLSLVLSITYLVSRLQSASTYPTFHARTSRFKNSFLPYCLMTLSVTLSVTFVSSAIVCLCVFFFHRSYPILDCHTQ